MLSYADAATKETRRSDVDLRERPRTQRAPNANQELEEQKGPPSELLVRVADETEKKTSNR